MSGPITNYELGKSIHREYEAQASRYWRQDLYSSQRLLYLTPLSLYRIMLTLPRTWKEVKNPS